MEEYKGSKSWVLTLVVFWWVANAISSIASKRFMIVQNRVHSGDNVAGVSIALQDFRWIDLTFIQLTISAILSPTCLTIYKSKTGTINMKTSKVFLFACLAHAVGNLSTNASFAAIQSSITLMIKSYEPVFTYIFQRLLDRKGDAIRCSTLLSLIGMSAGTGLFVAMDNSLNIQGILAALVSSLAFPIRNVCIKRASNSWDGPLQDYCFLSCYGIVFLLPIAVLKVLLTRKIELTSLTDIFVSSGSYFTYNMASIQVLEVCSPVQHSLLSLIKRILAIILNIFYFSIPMHSMCVIGIMMFLAGYLLYYKTSNKISLGYSLSFNRSKIIPALCCCLILTLSIPSLNQLIRHRITNGPDKYNTAIGKERQNIITSSWVYERSLPEKIANNVFTWYKTFPGKSVQLSCGTFSCVKTFADFNHNKTIASFLVISDLVENTIFDTWFNKHPLNKILEGKNFEDHLQQVILLSLIWKQGGTYIDPRVNIKTANQFMDVDLPWIAISPNDHYTNILAIANFPKEHTFIKIMGQTFLDQHSKKSDNIKTWPINFNFREIVLTTCKNHIELCPKIIRLEKNSFSVLIDSILKRNFGTLSYDSRVLVAKDANLGDEVQGFPGLQFVPFTNQFLERDQLNLAKEPNVTLFFNAWWGSSQQHWPPPENVDPIMLSMHIGNAVKPLLSNHIEYLRNKSPIGCRDTPSCEYLRQQNVSAFFSGCLTLLMKNPNKNTNRNQDIYLVDISDDVRKLLPIDIQQKGITIQHNMVGPTRFNKFVRFKEAYNLIIKYSKAKLVVTQRIHSALPCVAMGTPVIFINSPDMPGGGGTKKESSPRTQGLDQLLHLIDLYKLSRDEAKTWLGKFDWNNPHTSTSASYLKRLRATSWNVIRQRKGLYEAALKFGVVPFPDLIPLNMTKQKLFHLIFTTNNTQVIPLFNKGQNVVSAGFNWRHWRCAESIFYHHPFAKVIVHSNTLSQATFNVLTESGYDIEVQNYDLSEMASGTPAESFMVTKYNKVKNGRFWYSHATDLLRMTILYKMGGVYMDTDVILVRPIDDLPANVVGYEDDGRIMNGAFMRFQEKHPFLRKSLEDFAKNYNQFVWSANGPRLITKILHTPASLKKYDVNVLSHFAFYMFPYFKVEDECFVQKSGDKFERNIKILEKVAFAVHLFSKFSAKYGLNEKLKEGTICKTLMNSFCVLCDKEY